MAAFEVIALDTATPQLRAPGASDTYTFPRAVEMPLGTANGVLYLNGSKVVTSGSALTFNGTELGTTSTGLNINNANALVRYQNGSGTRTGYLQVRADAFDIWSDQAAVPMVFAVANSEQMRLTSTGLGIGTSSPGAKLGVVGNAIFSGTVPYIALSGSQATTASYLQYTVATSQLDILSSGAIDFQTGGTIASKMRLDASGNLGLGVTPSAWSGLAPALQVQRASIITSSASAVDTYFSSNAFYDGSWKYILSAPATQYMQNASGDHRWRVAASGTAGNAISFTQAMTLNASGNLGLGITSPSLYAGYTTLAINNATNGGIIDLMTNGTRHLTLYSDPSTSALGTASNTNLSFLTNGTERARITSGGAFLVGTTSTNGAFSLNTNTETWAAWLQQAHTTTGRSLVRLQYTVATPNVATDYFLYCDDATAVRANIRSNGGLANYQSNNVDLSDARTKKDITPAPSYWSKIGALEIVTYKYKDQTHDDINVGVIAQQVEQVEPVWVDTEGFGEVPEGEEPMKTVYTKDITFAAIKALQEAMFRIEALEAKVAALETH